MIKIVSPLFVFLLLTLTACGGEKEKKPKSPTLYGAEFCECVVKNNLDDSKCMHIIEAVKEAHGAENEEAEREFKNAVKKCVRNKTYEKVNQQK